MIKEEFIYFLWKTKNFQQLQLKTTDGRELSILTWGSQNHDSGPDFSRASIALDNEKWAGNIEMHVKSSDWYLHRHQKDPSYNSVILHVVWKNNGEVYTEAGFNIPTLELEPIVRSEMLENYLRLQMNQKRISCEGQIHLFSGAKLNFWKERLGVERLNEKSRRIEIAVKSQGMDWETAFYKHLGTCFGLSVNREGFEILTRIVPISVIRKYSDSRFKIEALLYGSAGFLSIEYQEKYPKALLREYTFLKHKHDLEPMDPRVWKLSKMRPISFPTIRISLFAQILAQPVPLLRRFIECKTLKDAERFLEMEASDYWDDHYLFDRISARRKKKLGKSFCHGLLINAIVPFIYGYGKMQNRDEYCEKAMDWMVEIQPETNKITRQWNELGISISSAFESQALLHLYKEYCQEKRCLDCSIGCDIVRQFYTFSEGGVQYRLINPRKKKLVVKT